MSHFFSFLHDIDFDSKSCPGDWQNERTWGSRHSTACRARIQGSARNSAGSC